MASSAKTLGVAFPDFSSAKNMTETKKLQSKSFILIEKKLRAKDRLVADAFEIGNAMGGVIEELEILARSPANEKIAWRQRQPVVMSLDTLRDKGYFIFVEGLYPGLPMRTERKIKMAESVKDLPQRADLLKWHEVIKNAFARAKAKNTKPTPKDRAFLKIVCLRP